MLTHTIQPVRLRLIRSPVNPPLNFSCNRGLTVKVNGQKIKQMLLQLQSMTEILTPTITGNEPKHESKSLEGAAVTILCPMTANPKD